MNTKTDGISSGLVATCYVETDVEENLYFSAPNYGYALVRLSDAEAIINDLQTLVIAENQRKQQLEAEVALMKVECGESQYCAGCNDAAKIIEEQVERIKVLEAQNKGLQSGLDTDYAQLYQEQVQIGTKQLAALKLAMDALGEVQDLIGESHGVYGLHLNGDESPWGELEQGGRFERLTSLNEALAAIDALKGE